MQCLSRYDYVCLDNLVYTVIIKVYSVQVLIHIRIMLCSQVFKSIDSKNYP